MRQVHITHTLYKFEELSEEAQKKAIETFQQWNYENYDNDRIKELFEDELKELGYPAQEIEFGLGYCQSDGVAFYGVIENIEAVVRRLFPNDADRRIEEIQRTGTHFRISRHDRYRGEFIMLVYSNGYYEDGDENNGTFDFLNEISDRIQKDAKETAKKLQKMGYESIEYESSEEAAKERIECDDWEFSIDGKPYTDVL